MANTLFEVEMLGAALEANLGDAIKLYPLTNVVMMDEQAGATVKIPTTQYIGDAEVKLAGGMINPSPLVQSTKSVAVYKVAKAVAFTQEDINNAYMDVQAIAEKQLLKSIANKVEGDLFQILNTGTVLTADIPALDVDGLADAVVPFGEDLEEPMYLLVNPADLAVLRKDDNFIVNANHGNAVIKSAGEIFGMQVIVTNRVTAKTAYIIKEGALALYLKKDVEIEQDKDILTQSYHIVATQHFAVHLADESKAIKVTIQ